MRQTIKPFKTLVRLSLATFITFAGIAAAHAATYPDRPITLIVPYPPGGTTDISARTLANVMQKQLKQTIVIENRAGAGGSIGMGVVAHAKPDGYTLGLGTIGTQSINHFLYKDMSYDPATAFVPIALVITTPNVIAVGANSNIKTLAELIATAKKAKDGKKLSYASPGIGSSVHLTAAYFEQSAGIEMLHVPYKGAGQSIPAAMGGQVDVLLDNLPSSLAQLKDGSRLRGIAVTSAQRSPAMPNIPTVAESGLPGFDVTAWFGLYAPAGTPKPVVDTLIDAAKKALDAPELKAKFVSLGAQAGTLLGSDLAAFEHDERERWSKLIKERHITAQ